MKIFLYITFLFFISSFYAQAITFKITSLSTNLLYSYNHSTLTGDDRGVIAVSQSYLYYNGDTNGARFALNDLGTPTAVPINDGLLTNMNGQTLMSLGVGASTPLTIAIPNTGSQTLTHLITHSDTGSYVSSVALSSSITVNTSAAQTNDNISNCAIFSGYDKAYLISSGILYGINLINGQVTNYGSKTIAYANSESWAASGIAETFNGEDYLTYVANDGTSTSHATIKRTRISDGYTEALASFTTLGDAAAFTVAPNLGRWYFHHEYTSQYAPTAETVLAFAATFQMDASVPEPTNLVLFGIVSLLIGMRFFKKS